MLARLMPLLLQASKEWHMQKQGEGVQQPLRAVLFRTLMEELLKRAQLLKFDAPEDALIKGLRTRQILTTSNHWNFLGWDHNSKCLKPTKQDLLSSPQLHEMLQRMIQLSTQAHVFQKFAAMKPMPKEFPGDQQISIAWRLDISVRTPESSELCNLVNKLCGNGLTQLVAMRHRPTGLQRSPLANAIAQKLRR